MKKLASKCACSSSGIGICLCTIFMTVSMVGTALTGISKSTNSITSIGSMQGMAPTQSQDIFVNFFSGFWGEIILLISFGLMLYGIWSSGNNRRKLIPISVTGAVILYVSMYGYFSLALEIVGVAVLAIAYGSTYSCRIASAIKLT